MSRVAQPPSPKPPSPPLGGPTTIALPQGVADDPEELEDPEEDEDPEPLDPCDDPPPDDPPLDEPPPEGFLGGLGGGLGDEVCVADPVGVGVGSGSGSGVAVGRGVGLPMMGSCAELGIATSTLRATAPRAEAASRTLESLIKVVRAIFCIEGRESFTYVTNQRDEGAVQCRKRGERIRHAQIWKDPKSVSSEMSDACAQ